MNFLLGNTVRYNTKLLKSLTLLICSISYIRNLKTFLCNLKKNAFIAHVHSKPNIINLNIMAGLIKVYL